MRMLILAFLLCSLNSCLETTTYPLHEVLAEKFETISKEGQKFQRTDIIDGNSETRELTPDEFMELAEEFMKEFPDVDKRKGTVSTQNHKYQGKRKFIEYDLGSDKDEESEASLMFHIDDEGEEVLSNVSYMRMRDADRPNPSHQLQLNFLVNKFSILKKNSYYTVEWQ